MNWLSSDIMYPKFSDEFIKTDHKTNVIFTEPKKAIIIRHILNILLE